MNIYTQFGDLTPSQMLTLFSLFRKWPEYKESSFLASFENNMLKMEASVEQSVEGIAEDDDLPVEQADEENETLKSTKEAPAPPTLSAKSSKKSKKEN